MACVQMLNELRVWWSGRSIRTQILLVILLSSLPLSCLAAYQCYYEINRARHTEEDMARHIAQVNAAEVSRIIAETRIFLSTLARDPDVVALDPKRCAFARANYVKLHPEFSNLRTNDSKGNVICSAIPFRSGANVYGSDYSGEQPLKDDFFVGRPLRGHISNRWVVPLGAPIKSSNGTAIGDVYVPLDLLSFNPYLGERSFKNYPEGTVTSLLSSNLVLLTRSKSAEKWIGETLDDTPNLTALIRAKNGISRFALQMDDGEMIHAAAPVEGTDWVIVTSIPTQTLDRNIQLILNDWISISALAYGLSLILAYILARHTSFPLLGIVSAAERIKDGDPNVRVATTGCQEVSKFATTFNEIMDYLQHQQLEIIANEERYHSIFSDARIPMLLIAPGRGDIVDANASAVAFYGWDLPTLRAMKIFDINTLTPEQICAEMSLAEEERRDHFYFVHRLATGEVRDVEVHSGPIEMNGEVYLLSSIHDITKRKQDEKQLKLAANVFLQANEGIVITDAHNVIIDVNNAFTEITGYSREEAVGQKPNFLKSGHQPPEFYSEMWNVLKTEGSWYGEIWNRRKDGEMYAELINISLIYDETGAIKNHLAIFSDITTLKKHQEQLEHIAHYDALTGLPNRVLLADRLQQAMAHSLRSHELLAVVYLDLDGFKAINDTHGHEAGDSLLIEVAKRMRFSLRVEDTLARIGGDEFIAILTNLKSPEECEPSITRLLSAAAEPVMVGSTLLKVSASAGITIYPSDGGEADQLIRHADQAMYLAKQSGKNRFCLFDVEQDTAIKQHREATDRIEEALKNNEFVLYYQPKVHMGTGQVMGAEALIRWQHPERGLLPPGEFLPVVENRDTSIEIDNWVMSQALTQMEIWQDQGISLPVSINIGARRLQHGDFASYLKERLEAHPNIAPELLEIELLESSALDNINNISELMHACQSHGVRFALDDFGTGYSALTYLRRLPADVLKIDQSFIRGMLENPDDLAIVEGVLGLVAAFRCKAIAEGVETADHGQLLLGLGCYYGQGYGIARPMPAAQIPDWITTWTPPEAWRNWGEKLLSREEQRWLIAEIGHLHWMDAIEHFTKTGKGALPPMDIHKCHFGRWIDLEGRGRYGHLPQFRRIDDLHVKIHDLGHQIIDLHLAGQADAAQALLVHLHDLKEQFRAELRTISGSFEEKH